MSELSCMRSEDIKALGVYEFLGLLHNELEEKRDELYDGQHEPKRVRVEARLTQIGRVYETLKLLEKGQA